MDEGMTVRQAQGERGPSRFPPITVDVMRGSLLESRHVVYGALLRVGEVGPEAALAGREGLGWGDGALPTVMRSALKPFQLLPFVVDGAADAFGVTQEELALAAASHCASAEHLRVLGSFMEKTGVREGMLRVPGHAPVDLENRKAVGRAWGPLHDNCSGKHAAMVAWCLHEGHDPTGYTSRDHPLQKRIRELLKPLVGHEVSSFGAGIDGCRVPTVAFPLATAARLFLLLGVPSLFAESGDRSRMGDEEAKGLIDGLRRISGAMTDHPLMVGGADRADTQVIQATGGRVLTKVGAEAVWAGVDRKKRVGFAFKAIDGGSRAVVPAALTALAQEGLFEEKEQDDLESWLHPVVKDRGGDRSGRIVVQVPERGRLQ